MAVSVLDARATSSSTSSGHRAIVPARRRASARTDASRSCGGRTTAGTESEVWDVETRVIRGSRWLGLEDAVAWWTDRFKCLLDALHAHNSHEARNDADLE